MSLISTILDNKNSTYTESNGYYERVPIRVGEFTLLENEQGCVKFETTSVEFCTDGPKIIINIDKNENGEWGVNVNQGCCGWSITPHEYIHNEKLSRRRAFWHASQYMNGIDLNYIERFSLRHKVEEDNPNIFDSDAYFKNGNARTTDPFGEFLK